MKIPKDLGFDGGRAGWADSVQVAGMVDTAGDGLEEVCDTRSVDKAGSETNGTSEEIDVSGTISGSNVVGAVGMARSAGASEVAGETARRKGT